MTEEAPVPVPLSTSTTPSGLEIAYFMQPKRKYEVRSGSEASWIEVPSVTTALDALPKTLQHWGQRIGVEGALELHRRGILREAQSEGQRVLALPGPLNKDGATTLVVAGGESVIAYLKAFKLTVNDHRDKGGEKGQSAHSAFELWAEKGTVPEPDMFPPHERGYIDGLVAFLEAIAPGKPEVLFSEVMVGSVKHRFAGRYDIQVITHEPCEVIYHRTPVRGPKYRTLPAGRHMWDLKTSADVFPDTHFRQLEAYELASVECGYEPTDERAVIHVSAEGEYKLVPSSATAEDFLVVLELVRSNKRIQERKLK